MALACSTDKRKNASLGFQAPLSDASVAVACWTADPSVAPRLQQPRVKVGLNLGSLLQGAPNQLNTSVKRFVWWRCGLYIPRFAKLLFMSKLEVMTAHDAINTLRVARSQLLGCQGRDYTGPNRGSHNGATR